MEPVEVKIERETPDYPADIWNQENMELVQVQVEDNTPGSSLLEKSNVIEAGSSTNKSKGGKAKKSSRVENGKIQKLQPRKVNNKDKKSATGKNKQKEKEGKRNQVNRHSFIKMQVLNFLDAKNTKAAASRSFGVPESTIRGWAKDKDGVIAKYLLDLQKEEAKILATLTPPSIEMNQSLPIIGSNLPPQQGFIPPVPLACPNMQTNMLPPPIFSFESLNYWLLMKQVEIQQTMYNNDLLYTRAYNQQQSFESANNLNKQTESVNNLNNQTI